MVMDALIVFLSIIFAFCLVFACGYVAIIIMVLCEDVYYYLKDKKYKKHKK